MPDREEREAFGARFARKLRAMPKGYPVELLVLDVMQNEGIRKPAELTERTGKSAAEIDTGSAASVDTRSASWPPSGARMPGPNAATPKKTKRWRDGEADR